MIKGMPSVTLQEIPLLAENILTGIGSQKIKNFMQPWMSAIYEHQALDPVYTVPDPHGHDIKLNSSTTSVALTLTIVLQN